jgi:hypothetical protein
VKIGFNSTDVLKIVFSLLNEIIRSNYLECGQVFSSSSQKVRIPHCRPQAEERSGPLCDTCDAAQVAITSKLATCVSFQ